MLISYAKSIFFMFISIGVTRASLVRVMSSVTRSCTAPKLNVIAFDFDKTCTRDLILDIYKAREDYHGDLKDKLDEEWSKLEQLYVFYSKRVVFPLLQETEPFPAMFDEEGLRDFLKKWQEVDTLVSNDVIKSDILKGITENGIKEFAKGIELMPNVLEVLESIKTLNKLLHVISLNFSRKLITDVLNRQGTLPLVVHTNELVFHNGVSTGALDETVASAFDKEVEFQRIVGNSSNCGISIYIGDSYNDVLALLKADVGFVIGKSKSMRQICHNFGIEIMPYQWSTVQTKLSSTKSQPVFFSVKSWLEVKDFVFRL